MTLTRTVLNAYLDEVRGSGSIDYDNSIVIPTTPDRLVVVHPNHPNWPDRWSGHVGTVPVIGPPASAPTEDVVRWLREIANCLPDLEPETFVVGLPVVITVLDGSIRIEVDLSEADDIETDHLTGDMLQRYAATIRSAVLHGRVTYTS